MKRFLFLVYQILFRYLARWFPSIPRTLDPSSFRTILVFSAAGIGDTLTDSVAIRALKERFPSARLLVVTHRRRRVLADHNPCIDEIIPYHKSLVSFPALVWKLRRRRPDVVVMLRGNDPDLWPMAWLVRKDAVVSCPIMTKFDFLISHRVEIPRWDTTHGVEQTLEIVRFLGADSHDRGLVYRVREEEKAALQQRLRGMNIPLKPGVVFQLGGGRRSAWRDWPVDYFAELADRLNRTWEVNLFLTGGRDLHPKGAALQARLKTGAFNLVGQLALHETAALLALSNILVSTDTGVMHLGFAVGIDTLALIHCNNPSSRVGPYGYGDKHRVAQLVPPPGIAPSKDIDMRGLTPDMVWPLLKELCLRHQPTNLQGFK